MNKHFQYDSVRPSADPTERYKGQLYHYDLTKSRQLKAVISHFLNNLSFPDQLETVAEPTLVKKLLSTKRELIIQGIHFSSKSDKKLKRKQLRILSKKSDTLDLCPDNFQTKTQHRNIEEESEELLAEDKVEDDRNNHIGNLIQKMSDL